MAGRHDARGPMDIHADIDVAGQLRFACVDANPDLDVGAIGPRLGGDRTLDANSGLDRVARGPEHGKERVAFHSDLGAAAIAGLANELVMPREQRSVVGSSSSTSFVEPSISVNMKVAVPVGSAVIAVSFVSRPRNDKQPPTASGSGVDVPGLSPFCAR